MAIKINKVRSNIYTWSCTNCVKGGGGGASRESVERQGRAHRCKN